MSAPEQKHYGLILRAETPIAHHSGTIGNHGVLMRRKIRQPDGSFVRVPYITGDCLRHLLRESAAWALLDAAGLSDMELTEDALRLLFAGGMVRGSGSTVKLEQWRRWLSFMPSLDILGGCAENRIQPGLIRVNDARLICAETEHLLTDWELEWLIGQGCEISGSRDHVEEVQRVRMDPTNDPHKSRLLGQRARLELETRLAKSAKASSDDDDVAKLDSKGSMMPRTFETVVSGSLFSWGIDTTFYTDLQRDTFLTILAVSLRHAAVGGKQGTGHGQLKALAATEVQLKAWSDRTDSLDLSTGKVGDLFRAHVASHSDDLRAFLAEVKA